MYVIAAVIFSSLRFLPIPIASLSWIFDNDRKFCGTGGILMKSTDFEILLLGEDKFGGFFFFFQILTLRNSHNFLFVELVIIELGFYE